MPRFIVEEKMRPLRPRPLREQALPHDGVGEPWPLAGPLLALVAGWLIMVWPWLVGRVTIPWDAKAQFLPQIQFLAQSFARGESPFWAPFVFAGQNQIADPQSMIYSPPFLLLAFCNGNPSAYAVDVTTLLVQLAGAAALMLWFRDRGWHAAGALVAGLTFAFGASMAWRLQHTGQVLSLAYWPMAMLALDRMLERRSFLYAMALGLVLAAILLGRDQVALLALYLLAAQGVWRVAQTPRWAAEVRAVLLPATLASIVALALAIVPIIMTLLLAETSNRPSIDLEGAGRGSMHPAQFITLVMPQLFGAAFRMEDYWGPPSFAWTGTGLFVAQNMGQLYVGLLPLFIGAIAACRGWLWAREIRFFVVALVFVGFYAIGWYTPVFHFFYDLVPGVTLYRRPADATFLIGGLSAVVAGYATHRLVKRPWFRLEARDWLVVAVVIAVSLALALVFAVRLDHLAVLPYPLMATVASVILAIAALIVALPRRALEPFAAALILGGATAADLAWNNGPSSSSGLPPRLYDAFNPDTKNPVISTLTALVEAHRSATERDRVELLALGFDWPNVSLTHRLENTLGYNPVRSQLYTAATGAQDNIGLPEERKFSPLLPSYRSLLVDLLGLRYVASGVPLEKIDPRLKPGDWRLLTTTGGAWIYENPRALPRVLFVRQSILADFDALLMTGEWPEFDPRRAMLIGEGGGVYYSGAPDASPKVAITHYENTVVEINAESATGGFVVLNDVWQPWWSVRVDGRPAKLLRANVLFRAVEVPAGAHHISFRFEPLQGAWAQLTARRQR